MFGFPTGLHVALHLVNVVYLLFLIVAPLAIAGEIRYPKHWMVAPYLYLFSSPGIIFSVLGCLNMLARRPISLLYLLMGVAWLATATLYFILLSLPSLLPYSLLFNDQYCPPFHVLLLPNVCEMQWRILAYWICMLIVCGGSYALMFLAVKVRVEESDGEVVERLIHRLDSKRERPTSEEL